MAPPPPSRRPGAPAYRLLLLAAALAGCNGRPSAPPLQEGRVYRNEREGFRFFAPEGWRQRARGEAPRGKLDGERLLAEYKCFTCAKPATLEVSVAEIPEGTSLSDYVTRSTLTGEKWQLRGTAEQFTINDAPAVRVIYTQRAGKEEMVREVVAFRRGARVYLFKGFYADSDAKSRKEIRGAVDSVVW
jgi:hypothetical protein